MERPPFRAIGRAVFFAFRGYCQLTILRTACWDSGRLGSGDDEAAAFKWSGMKAMATRFPSARSVHATPCRLFVA